jgi:hypothetical protein
MDKIFALAALLLTALWVLLLAYLGVKALDTIALIL